jgi:hypothetical protein
MYLVFWPSTSYPMASTLNVLYPLLSKKKIFMSNLVPTLLQSVHFQLIILLFLVEILIFLFFLSSFVLLGIV